MTVKARSNSSVDQVVGSTWLIHVRVYDPDGCPVADTVTVTVTNPAGSTSTPTVEHLSGGDYRAVATLATAGRYVAAVASASHGATAFTAYATPVVAAAGMPVRADVDAYLEPHSFTDGQLDEALAAELANQRKQCKVPAAYGADLRSAVFRRCARHLAMLRLPLAIIQGDAEMSTRVPMWDAEVRRFERPYRKAPVG